MTLCDLRVCALVRLHLPDFAFFSTHPGFIPGHQQHVNGGKKWQSCPTGAGGAPDLRFQRSHAHTEPEPHPVSARHTPHHPVADSSGSGSHQESQSHSLQHRLPHTATEVRLSPHAQPLSHDQRGEGSARLRGEAHQTHGTTLPQISSAGKMRSPGFWSRFEGQCLDPCCEQIGSEPLDVIGRGKMDLVLISLFVYLFRI